MPYYFEFDPTNKILRCTFEGRVDDEELNKYDRDAAKFASMTRPRLGVVDFSAVTAFEVTREKIVELAGSAPAIADPDSTRVLIAPSPVVYGMARMFEMESHRTRRSLHVVRTEQEAWGILGVAEPRFERCEK